MRGVSTDTLQPFCPVGLKIKTNSMYSHVIFIAFFKLQIENIDGDDLNQFLMDIPSCVAESDHTYHHKNIWGSTAQLWPLIP